MESKKLKGLWAATVGCGLLGALTAPAQELPSMTLRSVGVFETLDALGFSPDGVTYRAATGTLFVISAAAEASPVTGIYELSQQGELIAQFPLPADPPRLGYGITSADSGPRAGHFFLPEFTGTPTIQVVELDESLQEVGRFEVTGTMFPGDGITFNSMSGNLAIVDSGACELVEVTPSGGVVRTFATPCLAGVTFDAMRGTYLGVDVGTTLHEFTTDGDPVATYDLSVFGIRQAVGVGFGDGELYVADEIDEANTGGWIYTLAFEEDTGACPAGASVLCLNGDRFQVEVDWRDFHDNTGAGRVVSFHSADSGLFWFFNPNNWEMMVKVLDGCRQNGHFWVFAAATTNVEYTLKVLDTETDREQQYFNPLGVASPAITDTMAFPCASDPP